MALSIRIRLSTEHSHSFRGFLLVSISRCWKRDLPLVGQRGPEQRDVLSTLGGWLSAGELCHRACVLFFPGQNWSSFSTEKRYCAHLLQGIPGFVCVRMFLLFPGFKKKPTSSLMDVIFLFIFFYSTLPHTCKLEQYTLVF